MSTETQSLQGHDFRAAAGDLVPILAKHKIPLNALDIVFGLTKEIINTQAVQEQDAK